jgi:hypothetical protein
VRCPCSHKCHQEMLRVRLRVSVEYQFRRKGAIRASHESWDFLRVCFRLRPKPSIVRNPSCMISNFRSIGIENLFVKNPDSREMPVFAQVSPRNAPGSITGRPITKKRNNHHAGTDRNAQKCFFFAHVKTHSKVKKKWQCGSTQGNSFQELHDSNALPLMLLCKLRYVESLFTSTRRFGKNSLISGPFSS